jgi:tetratricopeptide (TPR) repeat protein
MHASRCWQESGGRLSCLSCHDPHTLFPEEQKAVAFRRQCLECHSDRGCALPDPQRGQTLPADNCIECHMPRLAAADVPHTTQTDHRILRIRPRPRDAVQQSGTETDSEPLIFGEGVDVPRWELDRARGIRLARWAESSGNRNPAFEAEHLLSPLADRLPDDADLLDALAMAYVLQGRKADASECWRQILEHDPEHPQALLALATLSQQRGDWEASLKFWDRLLAVNAWSAEGHAQRARVLQELGRSTEAVTAARQSLAVDPSDPVMTDWLAGRLQAAEQKANAERLRKQALRLKNLQQRKLRPAR